MADFPPPTDPGLSQAGGPVYTLSPWVKRFLGALIDAAPFLVIYFIGVILDSILGTSGLFEVLGWLGGLGFSIWNLIQQGNTGQTIGKKIIGIKLVRESDAQVVGVGLSIGRYFLHIIDSVPCVPVGYLWPLWDQKRQTFADKLLQTVVIDV